MELLFIVVGQSSQKHAMAFLHLYHVASSNRQFKHSDVVAILISLEEEELVVCGVCVCVLPLLAAAAAGQFLVSGFRSLHILDVYQELGREWDRSILISLGNLYSCRK